MAIDPLKDFPGYALRRASAFAMADFGERLVAFKLRPTDATVLLFIDANPGIKQSEIGRMLQIASANMAPLISRLEKRRLIGREQMDGRSHGLNLTATGVQLVIRLKALVAEHEAGILELVPAKHRKAFIESLQAIWNQVATE